MKALDRLLENRHFRHQVIAAWGKPGQPTPKRLYGKGVLVQHFALDRFSLRALCGGTVTLVSDQPFTTRTRLQCPLCVSVVARVMVRLAADQAASRTI